MTTRPVDTATPSLPARGRWYEPRSWIGTVALFVVGYVVFQTFWRLAFSWMDLLGEDVPFDGATWLRFELVVAGIGVVTGTLWWRAQRMRRGRWRRTLRSITRTTAFVVILTAERFSRLDTGRWLFTVALTAIVMGYLFSWTERWDPNEVEGGPFDEPR